MKNVFFIFMVLFAFTACNQSTNRSGKEESTSGNSLTVDNSLVNIYYFHGTQRCKTCIAVGNVAQETFNRNFHENAKVRFTELNTTEETNNFLVEKYDVSWNALIIAKGDQYKDITENAFATAVANPDKLSEEIVLLVNSMLQAE